MRRSLRSALRGALAHVHWGGHLAGGDGGRVCRGGVVALVFGAAVLRSAGRLPMLSLALAQVIWAVATQWVALTGGDNGVIGCASWWGKPDRCSSCCSRASRR